MRQQFSTLFTWRYIGFKMIPTYLERCILAGKATYKHVVVGQSGFGIIKVPSDGFIVIIEIVAECFADVNNGNFDDYLDITNNSTHQIVFKNNEAEVNYIVRADLNVNRAQLGGGPTNFANAFGHRTFHPYLVMKRNVRVNISRAPDVTGLAPVNAAPEGATQVKTPPLEYGGLASQPMIMEDATYSNVLQTSELNASPIGSASAFNNLRWPVDANTALNPITTTRAWGQRSYPIVNVGYVEFRNAAPDNILPSG